jgi:hypothetical protein
MTKVAIVGSCQAVGLGVAVRKYLQGAIVKSWHVNVDEKSKPENILRDIEEYDYVITQFNGADPLGEMKLSRAGSRTTYLPVIAFRGFHPDLIYVFDQNQRKFQDIGFGAYHSALTLAAYLDGFSEDRTFRLFNAAVFARLRYFEVFKASRAALLSDFAEAGYKIEDEFEEWLTHIGQFMYTINHPHITVLASLCRLSLIRLGLIDESAPRLRDALPDFLRTRLVWPVYPQLAQRMKISGSLNLLKAVSGPVADEQRRIPLMDYICRSFAQYRLLDRTLLAQSARESSKKLELLLNEATYVP